MRGQVTHRAGSAAAHAAAEFWSRLRANWQWMAFVLLGVVCVVAYLALSGRPFAQSLVFTSLPVAALTVVVVAAWRQRRRGWWVLAVGFALYVVATIVWYPLPVLRDDPLAFPSQSDALFLCSYVLFGIALVRATGPTNAWFNLDALVVSAALAGPVAELVLRPSLEVSSGSLAQAVAVAYPVTLLGLLALTCRLALADAHDGSKRWLLVAWMALELIGDCWYSVAATQGTFEFGDAWFCIWLAGYTVLGAAALRQRDRLVRPRAETSLSTRLRVLLVVSLIPLFTAAVVAARGTPPYFALSAAAVVTALSMWRISSLGADMRTLQSAHEQLDQVSAELRESSVHMRHQALHDSLTGLGNRVLFYERLDHTLAQRGRSAAVLMLDLNDFKRVNDEFGHHVGDALLTTVAERLAGAARAGDTVARWGGDEFVVILDDVAPPEARVAAERYLRAVQHVAVVHGHRLHVRASAGLAVATADKDSATIMREADSAMYAAKRGDTGTVHHFMALL